MSEAAARVRARAEEDALAARSSLKLYASLGHRAAAGVAKYLSDCYNRRGVRLMTKFRLGYLYNMETVAKLLHWPRAGATCVMCDSGETEDVTHMLLSCPYLEGCRSRLEAELLARLPAAGVPGDELLRGFHENADFLNLIDFRRFRPKVTLQLQSFHWWTGTPFGFSSTQPSFVAPRRLGF